MCVCLSEVVLLWDIVGGIFCLKGRGMIWIGSWRKIGVMIWLRMGLLMLSMILMRIRRLMMCVVGVWLL